MRKRVIGILISMLVVLPVTSKCSSKDSLAIPNVSVVNNLSENEKIIRDDGKTLLKNVIGTIFTENKMTENPVYVIKIRESLYYLSYFGDTSYALLNVVPSKDYCLILPSKVGFKKR